MERRKYNKREVIGSEYLSNVIANWDSFCKGHRKVVESIKVVMEENEALKYENFILKEQLKGIRDILR